MLRIIQNQAAAAAKSYYSQADYFSEGQEQIGNWGGKTAAILGLSGQVKKQEFDRLCDNLHPVSKTPLTCRNRSDRTVAYDINLHVPKGVTLAYELLGDSRIRDAFDAAAQETLEELEQDARTRVRRNGVYADRKTGNLVWAEYTHLTSRPVDGEPDPHLHKHFVTFNVTWDEEEQRLKAVQFRHIKRDAPYYEAAFHARLAKRLADMGYAIHRDGRHWDIAGIPAAVKEKFSRRTEQIESLADGKGIVDQRQKDKLGATSREKKRSDLTMDQLFELWWQRLDYSEQTSLRSLTNEPLTPATPPEKNAQTFIDRALLHSFERRSVVPKRRVLAEALQFGLGHVTPEQVQLEFDASSVIVRTVRDQEMATTPAVLGEETAMIRFAKEGQRTCQPLNDHWEIQRPWLNSQQVATVQHVLQSPDRVMLIRGGAGTGKTSLMTEAVEAIEAGGREVLTFAPSAAASRGVLQSEGFSGATTVAELLVNKELQAAAADQVIWIDEAGLVGSRTLNRVFELAKAVNARVILSGDWRQHGSVERGSPLKLLETRAGLASATVTEIQRQKGDYKTAVAAIAQGDLPQGYELLKEMGWIHQLDDNNRNQQVARDYADLRQAGQSTLVISPTKAEGERITDVIRHEPARRKMIRGASRSCLRLAPLHLTEAEKQDAAFYHPGDVVEFKRNAGTFRRGDRLALGQQVPAALLSQPSAVVVYRQDHISLAAGDLIRITANGKTLDRQHRLNNGAVYQVKGFDHAGNIRLQNGWTMAKDYGCLTHGYVSTSHAAQGKTVDHVLLCESQQSFPAGSQEQFYVSASRGREKCTIYTDDIEQLRDAVANSCGDWSATDLVERRQRQQRQAYAALGQAAAVGGHGR